MHPELFPGIPSYGTFILFAAFSGIFIFRKYVSKYKLNKEKYTDIAIWVFLGSFFFSKFFQVFIEYDKYLTSFSNFLEIFKFWKGGFAFLGGVLGGVFILFFLRKKIYLPRLFDIAAISLVYAHFIGRLGCLMAGCCWGKATAVPWAVTYLKKSAAYEYYMVHQNIPHHFIQNSHTVFAHPTQLYEATLNLSIAIFLILKTPSKKYHGEIALWYLLLYGIGRFIIEIFRGDPVRGFLFKFSLQFSNQHYLFANDNTVCCSTSQTISIFMILFSITFLVLNKKKF